MTTSTDPALIQQATAAAQSVIRKNFSDLGMSAASSTYVQVWARDSMITLLGAALDKDPTVMKIFRASIETLASHQTQFGQVPYLVAIDSGQAEFGSSDGNPWFVIGASYYATLSEDTEWVRGIAPAIVKALDYCEAHDISKTGLIHSGECTDWADLIANHGKVLFPNVLYARALMAAADMLGAVLPEEAARFRARYEVVKAAIQRTFWVKDPHAVKDHTHQLAGLAASTLLRRRPYFLPWVDQFGYGERFDTTANVLTVLTDMATPEQAEAILDYVVQCGANRPYPVRVLYPPIMPGESDWREYYKIYNLNMPNQYHNGGIWPWVGGMYVAALAKCGRMEEAQLELGKLAEALRQGKEEWECNEWLHGESGQPMGVRYQAWSAGVFLYAKHAVETGNAPALQIEK